MSKIYFTTARKQALDDAVASVIRKYHRNYDKLYKANNWRWYDNLSRMYMLVDELQSMIYSDLIKRTKLDKIHEDVKREPKYLFGNLEDKRRKKAAKYIYNSIIRHFYDTNNWRVQEAIQGCMAELFQHEIFYDRKKTFGKIRLLHDEYPAAPNIPMVDSSRTRKQDNTLVYINI